MGTHYTRTDAEFESQFQYRTLPPQLFTHEAHLRLAWIHLRKYGKAQAAINLCEQVKQFDATFDDGTKFHTTLTIAAVYIVDHFLQGCDSDTFAEFIEAFPRLSTNFKELILEHYSPSIFTNLEAKQSYLAPDLNDF